MLFDQIAPYILLINDQFTYILILFIGYTFISRPIFAKTLLLLLFTMVYNTWLKCLFQLPLPPGLEELGITGYGFPSGHMHMTMILWGSLAWDFKNKKFFLFAASIIILLSHATVNLGYHFYFHVVGGLAFGTLSITLLNLAISKYKVLQQKPYSLGYFLALVALPIAAWIPAPHLKAHIFLAFGALIGFSLGWKLLLDRKLSPDFSTKLLALLIGFTGTALLLLSYNAIPTKPNIVHFIFYFLLAFWLSGPSMILASKLRATTTTTAKSA